MKRRIISILLLQLVSMTVCFAEEVENVIYIDAEKYIRPSYLSCATMISEDRYWYSGTTEKQEPWILISDSAGEVIYQGIVPVERKQQIIKGVNVSDQGVLIGLVDAVTQNGMIMYRDKEGKTKYTELGNSNVYKYVPTDHGGLIAQCVWYDEDAILCAPQIISINAEGSVAYDIIGTPVESRIDQGALTCSLISEENGRVYALEVHGVPEGVGTKEELACYDENGDEVWRTTILNSENLWIHDVVTDGGSVYLVGYIGEWESKYVLGNRKGIVICYSKDGVRRWERIVSRVQEFRYGGAGNGVCVAGQMVDNRWRYLVMSDQGQEIYCGDFEAENCYMQKICVTEDKRIVVMGITDEKLIMKELAYE